LRGLPLFDSVLVVENFPLDSAAAAEPAAGGDDGIADGSARLLAHLRATSGLDVREFRASPMRLTFPVMITVLPQAELYLHVAYQTARFDPAAARHLLEQLRAVLDHLPVWSAHPLPGLPHVTITPPALAPRLQDDPR